MQVVLDLDETLVCAYETCSVPAVVRAQATEAGLKSFEIECLSSGKVCRPLFLFNFRAEICLPSDFVFNMIILWVEGV